MKNRLRWGDMRLRISGGTPERVLNLLAANRLPFRAPLAKENELELQVRRSDVRSLQQICQKNGLGIALMDRGLILEAGTRLRRRLALPLLLFPLLLTLWGSTLFIWDIQVHGNETVSSGEILRNLEELGVGVGSFRLRLDNYRISNEMLQRIRRLSWLSCNCFGSTLVVAVRETAPDPVMEGEEPVDVVAARSGVLRSITVLEGEAQTRRGQLVDAGQLLISARVGDRQGGSRTEHARAIVEAWTHWELTAVTPLSAGRKVYTGPARTLRDLFVLGKGIKMYIFSGNSYAVCDKIRGEKRLRLPGGVTLPFWLRYESSTAYEPVETRLQQEAARRWLEQRLHDRLAAEVRGSILSESMVTRVEDGLLYVTLRAVCLEDISLPRPAE